MLLRLQRRKAFTLIELLVVIVIIAILMGIALPAYLQQQVKAKESKVQQGLAVAYREARAAAIEEEGDFARLGTALLIAEMTESEPGMVFVPEDGVYEEDEIDVGISAGGVLSLNALATPERLCGLTAAPNAAPLDSCAAAPTTLPPLATISFSRTDYAVTGGAVAFDPAVADFNNDGYDDVAISTMGTISVRNGAASGTLTAATNYATRPNSFYLEVGDVSGDGHEDLVAVSNTVTTGYMQVFINNGSGSFAARDEFTIVGGEGAHLAVGEFTGDALIDVVVTKAGAPSGVTLFTNTGLTGTSRFTAAAGSIGGNWNLTAADWDADGDRDVATSDLNGNLRIRANNGTGTFAVSVQTVANVYHLAAQNYDLNGDNRPDIVAANGSNGALVFLNSGTGTFPAVSSTLVSGGALTRGVSVADVNRDGDYDVLATSQTAGLVSYFENNGNGTFAAKVDFAVAATPTWTATGDINGDDKLDIVSGTQSTTFTVLLNTGS